MGTFLGLKKFHKFSEICKNLLSLRDEFWGNGAKDLFKQRQKPLNTVG
jgi:hypothetical protein